MAPSGLYARLCHAFLVLNNFIKRRSNHMVVLVSRYYTRSNPSAKASNYRFKFYARF